MVASPIGVPSVLLLDEPNQDTGGEMAGQRKVCCH